MAIITNTDSSFTQGYEHKVKNATIHTRMTAYLMPTPSSFGTSGTPFRILPTASGGAHPHAPFAPGLSPYHSPTGIENTMDKSNTV
mgnify:FL=1